MQEFATGDPRAFLADQVQERCCRVFRATRAKFTSGSSIWADIRASFIAANLNGWDNLMHGMILESVPRTPPEGA